MLPTRNLRSGLTVGELLLCSGLLAIVIVACIAFFGREEAPPAPAGSKLPSRFELVELANWTVKLDVQANGKSYGTVVGESGNWWTTFEFHDQNGGQKLRAQRYTPLFGTTTVEIREVGTNRMVGKLIKQFWQSGFGMTVYKVEDGKGRVIAESDKVDWLGTTFTLKNNSGQSIATIERTARFGGNAWAVQVHRQGVIDHRVLICIAAFKTHADK